MIFFEVFECSLLIQIIGKTMTIAIADAIFNMKLWISGKDQDTHESHESTVTITTVNGLNIFWWSSKFLMDMYADIIMHSSTRLYRSRLSMNARAPIHTYTHFTVEPPCCSRTIHCDTSVWRSVVEWRTNSKRLRTYPHGIH